MTDHILDRLYQVLQERKNQAPDKSPNKSYVAKLYAEGVPKCAQKFGEEAVETVIEAMKLSAGDKTARGLFAQEAADSIFHLLVLCARLDVDPQEIWDVLEQRFGQPPRES